MHLRIVRDRKIGGGIFSEIYLEGQDFFCYGVENAETLIPAGQYKLVPHDGHKHNVVVFVNPTLGVYHQLADIPQGLSGRVACLIHAANWPRELEGCLAPGEKIVNFANEGWGVTESNRALDALRALWGDRTGHTAEIVDAYGH